MPNSIHTSKANLISLSDIEIIVSRAFDDEPEIIDYKLFSYSNETVGFLGTHLNLMITLRHSNNTGLEKHHFFAKTIPYELERQTEIVKKRGFFNQEAHFYNDVLPLLLENYDDEPWVPKCYLANENLTVMEDVRARGFKMHEHRIFDSEHLKSSAKALARMHACSILAEQKLGRRLSEVHPGACIEQIFRSNEKRSELLLALVENIGYHHGRSSRGLKSAFNHVCCMMTEEWKNDYGTILHGDTRSNNYMLRKNGECLIIDFQITRYGCRTWDLAQLIYYSTTRDTRMEEEMQVLKVHHDEFVRIIRKRDSTIKVPSWEDTLKEYEDARLMALFGTMFYYPFLLLDKEEYERNRNSPEAMYDKYIFRLDNEGVFDLMERNDKYKKEIVESALDLLDMCEKLFTF